MITNKQRRSSISKSVTFQSEQQQQPSPKEIQPASRRSASASRKSSADLSRDRRRSKAFSLGVDEAASIALYQKELAEAEAQAAVEAALPKPSSALDSAENERSEAEAGASRTKSILKNRQETEVNEVEAASSENCGGREQIEQDDGGSGKSVKSMRPPKAPKPPMAPKRPPLPPTEESRKQQQANPNENEIKGVAESVLKNRNTTVTPSNPRKIKNNFLTPSNSQEILSKENIKMSPQEPAGFSLCEQPLRWV